MHFLEDIAAANEFAVDVELGVGGPIAEDLYLFTNDWILENIDGFIVSES
jgi:hypothetical protein